MIWKKCKGDVENNKKRRKNRMKRIKIGIQKGGKRKNVKEKRWKSVKEKQKIIRKGERGERKEKNSIMKRRDKRN